MNIKQHERLEITNLKDMLFQIEKAYAQNLAYKVKLEAGKYKEYTYTEVKNIVEALGTALIDLGLKDKRIGIIGENRFEWEISYLSVVCGTGLVVPLDKSLPENELADLIERSEIEAIICTKKQEDAIDKIYKNGNTKLKYVISMERTSNKDGFLYFEELIKEGTTLVANGDVRFREAEVDSEKMGIMLFTSGTTSQSKVVSLSHKNICSNLISLGKAVDVDCDDVFLSILPLHHVFECTVGFLFALYCGAQIVFSEGIRHILENLQEYSPSVMACVPGVYERIFLALHKKSEKLGMLEEFLRKEELAANLSMPERKEMFKELHDLFGSNIKLFISGAAKLDVKIEEGYRALGFNLMQAYGLTETSPVVSICTNEFYRTGSVGKAVPDVEAKIDNPDENGIGELVVKGPNIMLGYYQNEEATNEVLKDGWFYTGDLAKIDDDGYIFIAGRKKNVIVLKNGKNVFPEEAECLINKIEGVRESLVFGREKYSDKEEVKIYALIVVDPAKMKTLHNATTVEEMHDVLFGKIKELNKTMPAYKSIKGIIVSDKELVKTATNKIKRQASLDAIKES